jgi:integrase
MIGKQAKVLSPGAVRRLQGIARRGPCPERDEVMVLLAVRAGLRAREIAFLTWAMVLDPHGRIAPMIEVRDSIAKRRSGRRVPLHPQLRRALIALRDLQPIESIMPEHPVLRSRKGGGLRPNSVVNWFVVACKLAGLTGCSSHSGRRTFITKAARAAHRAGASLRDVQVLAGHRSIETTQGYIDGDTDAQRRLIALI